MKLFGFKVTPLRVMVISIVVFVAMLHPGIRRIIWWILPMGSGYDDIFGGLALIAISVAIFVEIWTKVLPSSSIRKVNSKRYDG